METSLHISPPELIELLTRYLSHRFASHHDITSWSAALHANFCIFCTPWDHVGKNMYCASVKHIDAILHSVRSMRFTNILRCPRVCIYKPLSYLERTVHFFCSSSVGQLFPFFTGNPHYPYNSRQAYSFLSTFVACRHFHYIEKRRYSYSGHHLRHQRIFCEATCMYRPNVGTE